MIFWRTCRLLVALAFALAPALATARDATVPAATTMTMMGDCHPQHDSKPGKASPQCCVAGCATEAPAVATPMSPAYVAQLEPAAPRAKTAVSHSRGVEPPPPRTVSI